MDCINQYLILNIHQLKQICLQFLNSSGRKDLAGWLWFFKMFILCGVYKNASHTNKERKVPGVWYSNLAFAVKQSPDECDGTQQNHSVMLQ
jgi:hypothetical protein